MSKYWNGIKSKTLSLPVNTLWYSVINMLSNLVRVQTVHKQLAVVDEVTLLPENRKAILYTDNDSSDFGTSTPDNTNITFSIEFEFDF